MSHLLIFMLQLVATHGCPVSSVYLAQCGYTNIGYVKIMSAVFCLAVYSEADYKLSQSQFAPYNNTSLPWACLSTSYRQQIESI